MKRALFVAFCIFVLCSLLLLINVVTINASEPGYVRIDYNPSVAPTIDGKWTSAGEWAMNGEVTMIGDDVYFRSVWTMTTTEPIVVTDTFLVEFYNDNTNDTADYWQLCIDGDQSGGATPQTTDYRIDIVGHTTLTVYQGTGTGWTAVTPPSVIEWANKISDSPSNSTPHWILEMVFVKADFGAGPLWNFRLAMYDKSTDTLLAWPPTPRDEPNRWGVQDYVSGVVPEGFSLGVVVLLSSVAVAVGFYCLRKRSRIDEYGLGKLGK